MARSVDPDTKGTFAGEAVDSSGAPDRRLCFAPMAVENKGFMGGSMKFGVSEELNPDEKERQPLLPLRILVVTDLVPRAPHNAGASAPEANVDSLLDMVDVGGSSGGGSQPAYEPAAAPVAASSAMPGKFSDLIAQVARSGKSSVCMKPTEAVNRVEKALGAQIGAILQH